MLIEYFDRHVDLDEVDLIESEKGKRGQNTYEAENSKCSTSRAILGHFERENEL